MNRHNEQFGYIFCALMAADGYKTAHHKMYPQNTEEIYSNFTPRHNKHAPVKVDKIMSFGQQMAIRELYDLFETGFFKLPKEAVCGYMKDELSDYLGTDYDVTHFEELHDLGYLPVVIKALPEGTLVPIGVTVLTVRNTNDKFFWITNFLETILSQLLWKGFTSATIAFEFRKNLEKWCKLTDTSNKGFVLFQGHDFSMRGMDSLYATISSGLAHATSFLGSDSLPVIPGARMYYDAIGPVIHSVNATEHSVMSAGGAELGDELNTFRYLMEQFPTGILSIVSDTWDLWYVLTEILPSLKEEIIDREGKVVIRPDTGDPVEILCGEDRSKAMLPIAKGNEAPSDKGVIELLWDIFGGTFNEQGYKVLDPHIGAIYGDAITLARQEDICSRLASKGFASTNVVFGIGSYTFQLTSRDSWGFAMKATHAIINKESKDIFKDPITGDGSKKSAKGYLAVYKDDEGEYYLKDQVSAEEESQGELKTIFRDGQLYNQINFAQIRERITALIEKLLLKYV